jgi:hypothetical protein
MGTNTATTTKTIKAAADYSVTNDLNTYERARVRTRIGMIIVDVDGFAIGEVVGTCYGRGWYLVSDGKTTESVNLPWCFAATALKTEW